MVWIEFIICVVIAASLLSLIEWWLEHAMPYPVERMGQMYDALIIQATLTAL